jgi:hypothetical protein
MPKINDIVLVHGGFVDGAGWRGVYDILKKGGFNVSVVQSPTISLMGDVAATKLVIRSQPGPVVLVGHSYGGEAAVWNGWSIKAEYLYADFGATSTNSNNFVSSGVAIPATSFTHSDNLKANILRVGINYRFGTF